jgi:shikimate kinase
VWLEVSADEAARRLGVAGVARRPLLAGGAARERLSTVLAERHDLYAQAAHLRVATDGASVEQVADRVLEALAKVAS